MQKIIPGVACHTVETLVFLLPLVPPWTFSLYIPVAKWLDKICRLQLCVQCTNAVLRIILCGNSTTEQAETLWRNPLRVLKRQIFMLHTYLTAHLPLLPSLPLSSLTVKKNQAVLKLSHLSSGSTACHPLIWQHRLGSKTDTSAVAAHLGYLCSCSPRLIKLLIQDSKSNSYKKAPTQIQLLMPRLSVPNISQIKKTTWG